VVEALDALPFICEELRVEEAAAPDEPGRDGVTPAAFCESSGAAGWWPALAMLDGMVGCETAGGGFEWPPTRGNSSAVLMLRASERWE
jgi:hypothetical protein